MVNTIKYKLLVLLVGVFLLLGTAVLSGAQNIDAFARVSISPREGVVRQAYKVNISVYSSTWFTRPLEFTNLRIDNAFIIPFTRTVSGINYVNNKKYATLTFYYLVFPYNTGSLEIPELVINANIPPEGDYKGQPYTIRTKAQSIKVKPLPSSKENQVWMVATNVIIKETWSKSLSKLKVGDVVERIIEVEAKGTLPTLIKPLEIGAPEFISIYPKQAELKDKRDNQNANGERVERYSYLFEKEGEVIIPEKEVLWWNPENKRVHKRIIPGQKLSIVANPNLDLMESLKDSLMAMSVPIDPVEEELPFPWLNVVIFLILLGLTIYLAVKTLRLIVQFRKENKEAYLESEAYYFKQVGKALQEKNKQHFINSLYKWFDKSRQLGQPAAICGFLNAQEKELLNSLFQNENTTLSAQEKNRLKELLHLLRRNIKKYNFISEKEMCLNPGSN